MDKNFSAYIDAVEAHRAKTEQAARLLIGVVPSNYAWVLLNLLELLSADNFFSL